MTDTASPPQDTRRAFLGGRSLRQHAARGVLINTGFTVAVSVLNLLRGFALAAFLTASDYGVWGTVIVVLMMLLLVKQVGISDKYIQQEDADQELAFQKAFTLEAMMSAVAFVLVVIAAPLVALAYGDMRLMWATLSFAAILPTSALQMPIAAYYRSMQFAKQGVLQTIDPIVATIVSLGLAIAGAGYWALFGGLLAGAWATAAVAIYVSPYKLRFRYDRGTLASYWAFSWPLFLSAAGSMVIAFTSLVAANVSLGLAGAGVLTLSANISAFTQRVDFLITGTLYPAICAAADRIDTLRESFLKSNRLALMWAMPFGFGLTLFAGDMVQFLLGQERWKDAVPLLQIYGVVAAVGQIGFNWDAYFRARGETRPLAVSAIGTAAVFLVTAIPLLFIDGLRGFGIGVGLQMVANLAFRAYYLARLFEGFGFLMHMARAMLPVVPGTVLILVLRQFDGYRTLPVAAAELTLFVIFCAVSTWLVEGPLLKEAAGYVRPRTVPA